MSGEMYAYAIESNKQKARHVAAQRFLKKLYPSSHYTWKKCTLLITTLKEPLTLVLKR